VLDSSPRQPFQRRSYQRAKRRRSPGEHPEIARHEPNAPTMIDGFDDSINDRFQRYSQLRFFAMFAPLECIMIEKVRLHPTRADDADMDAEARHLDGETPRPRDDTLLGAAIDGIRRNRHGAGNRRDIDDLSALFLDHPA